MLFPKKFFLFFLGLMFAGLAHAGEQKYVNSSAPGEASPILREKSTFSIQLENDFFSGIDGNYTNGTKVAYASQTYAGFEAPDDNRGGNMTSSYLATGLGTLLGGTNASPGWSNFCGMQRTPALRQQWGLTLTQSMFTPEHKSYNELYGERSYAGYLGFGLVSMVKNEDRANSLELQIGTTGDPSLTRNTQHFVHKRLGMAQWPGWDHQLPSEVTFCVFFKRYYRLDFLEYASRSGRFETDGFAFWHTDLGTLYLRGGGGVNYRFGYNLPVSSPELSIAGATLPTAPFARKKSFDSRWSYYGFAGAAGRYVARDIFLDGTAFHTSPHLVDKFPFVFDIFAGGAIKYKDLELVIGYMMRTKEYHTQESPQVMGSVQIRYSF